MQIKYSSKLHSDFFSLIIPYFSTGKNTFNELENYCSDNTNSALKNFFKTVNHDRLPKIKSTSIPIGDGLAELHFLPLTDKMDPCTIKKTSRKLAKQIDGADGKGIYICFDFLQNQTRDLTIEAIINGLLLNQYKVGIYKTTESLQKSPEDLTILCQEQNLATQTQIANRAIAIAESQMDIFRLVDAPSNKKSPSVLADYALKTSEEGSSRLQCTVYNKEEIIEKGFYGLLAVNQASPSPPVFIKLEYRGGNEKSKHIGIVGKGVTFDTGGISLKRSSNMHLMKSDMGGGAAVLGLMRLVDKLQLDINLTGIVPATDNSIDKHAVKPSDVINSYSGKTIEVIDTDAEGRLLLADGLSYMQKHYNPDVLLDIATLTGSCITALGTFAAGFITNNSALSTSLMNSGYTTGEKVWELPNWDEYNTLISSNIADVKNFSGYPRAGAITAGKFLEHFIDDHQNWAHLDIAGMAMENDAGSSNQVSTAFGLRLLLDFIEEQLA